MPTALINANNLSVAYSKGENVLSDLNFTIPTGPEILGLIGANGAGKTTLLRVIAGQLAFSGECLVGSASPFDNQHHMDHTILTGIDSPFPGDWRVKHIFKAGGYRWVTWDQDAAETLALRFGVGVDKRYRELSRGQRSAVGIIVALASGCSLVLLDEPYLGLDVSKRGEFYRVLTEYAEIGDRTFIISTHHLNEISALLDRVMLIDAGRVVLNGVIDDLMELVLEITGTTEAVDRLISQLGVTGAVRHRSDQSGATKLVLDLRQFPKFVDELYTCAGHLNVRVAECTLEKAVLAITEPQYKELT